jgi:hypothetical protein
MDNDLRKINSNHVRQLPKGRRQFHLLARRFQMRAIIKQAGLTVIGFPGMTFIFSI